MNAQPPAAPAGALRIVSRREIAPERWDSFVDSCDQAWLWHRYDLQDALASWNGRRDLSFAALDSSNSEILALVPLQVLQYREAKIFPVAELDSFGGIAFKNGLGEAHQSKIWNAVLSHLRQTAKELRASEWNAALPPMSPAYRGERCPRVNPLLRLGFANTLTQTWAVNLQKGAAALWDGLEKRARNAIRKAEKLGVQIRAAEHTPQDVEDYYRLHCETYARTGASPHPKAYFEAIWRNFLARGLAYGFFAVYQNEVVAAETFGVYKNAAIYWTGAASARGLKLQASSFIQWTAMKQMQSDGVLWYETGEAFPNAQAGKLKGLNDFKRAFGGELYPFYRGRMVFRKRWRALKQSYLLWQEAWKG